MGSCGGGCGGATPALGIPSPDSLAMGRLVVDTMRQRIWIQREEEGGSGVGIRGREIDRVIILRGGGIMVDGGSEGVMTMVGGGGEGVTGGSITGGVYPSGASHWTQYCSCGYLTATSFRRPSGVSVAEVNLATIHLD